MPIRLGDGSPVTYGEPSDESHVNLIAWQDAYYLSVITRQNDLLEILQKVPYKSLMQSSTSCGDEINYRYIDLLKAVYFDKEFGRHRVLRELEELCMSGPDGTAPNKYVRDVTVPMLEVLRKLDERDEAEFNRALEAALRGHKKYWTSGRMKKELHGLVSLQLTAFAAIGHDRGIKITLKSDYTPARWVDGSLFAEAI